MVSDIMTLPDVAEYLKVDKKTIYRMVQAKQIPAFRVRSEWRFKKSVIDEWAESQNGGIEIPVIGRIAAGTPILAEENIESTITIDRSWVRNPDKVFALKVQGDSMINAEINDGDTVIIHQQPTAENGEIVAVMIDNEATLKRFYMMTNGKVKLKPENNRMKPIIVDPEDKNVRIAGKVERVIKKV